MTSIYKNETAKTEILALYEAKLAACNITYIDEYVDTFAGKTHIIITGDRTLPPLVLLHGINAGAPLALEAIKDLNQQYCIYAFFTPATLTPDSRAGLRGSGRSRSRGRWTRGATRACRSRRSAARSRPERAARH